VTLAPDVHFRSPVVFAPYEGRETLGALLRVVGDVLAPEFAYRWQVREGDREVLCFSSRVGEREVEGVDLLRYNEDGQVAEADELRWIRATARAAHGSLSRQTAANAVPTRFARAKPPSGRGSGQSSRPRRSSAALRVCLPVSILAPTGLVYK